jgi:hypothetical protein
MLTLAFGMLFYSFLYKFYTLTGGDEGIRVLRPLLLGQPLPAEQGRLPHRPPSITTRWRCWSWPR